jgi:hypothetical protein
MLSIQIKKQGANMLMTAPLIKTKSSSYQKPLLTRIYSMVLTHVQSME